MSGFFDRLSAKARESRIAGAFTALRDRLPEAVDAARDRWPEAVSAVRDRLPEAPWTRSPALSAATARAVMQRHSGVLPVAVWAVVGLATAVWLLHSSRRHGER